MPGVLLSLRAAQLVSAFSQQGRFRWGGVLAPIAASALILVNPVNAEELRIAGVEAVIDLPTLIVDRHHLLDGKDVTISYDYVDAQTLRKLRAGEADFAVMAITPLVFDALADDDPGQPGDPIILASLSHSVPLVQILSRAGRTDASPTVLEGQRVAVVETSAAHFIWTLFVAENGLDTARIELVFMPIQDMPAAIADGRVDAAVLWPPLSSQILANHPDEITVFSTEGLYVANWMLVSRRDVVAAEPTRTRAILRAYRDAIAWIQQNPDLAKAELAEAWPQWNKEALEGFGNYVYGISLDWSVFRAFREESIWAQGITGADGEPLPRFLIRIAPGPLAAVEPAAVHLPAALLQDLPGPP